MWLFYVSMYIILSVIFTQLYKISTDTSKDHGNLTILIQMIAGISILILTPFFDFSWSSDYRVYVLLCVARGDGRKYRYVPGPEGGPAQAAAQRH
jgi:quinol-cytochrome oxidoreductase complex cytochrome b subunit